jgi:hypothetical protein
MLDLSVLADWSFLDFFKVFFAMSLFSLSICPSGAMLTYLHVSLHCHPRFWEGFKSLCNCNIHSHFRLSRFSQTNAAR